MLTLQSPAKINLFLKILGKRPDGYHEIASLFQAIDLCDTMHFKLSQEDTFTCSDPSLPTDENNLVIKARELFRRKTGRNNPVSIQLQKNIPHQAGLGGGSSNAATTLWALNQLCGTPATAEQLAAWGAEIGSDVSFFLSQGTAYCTGRGEKLLPLPSLNAQNVWIVKPPVGLSTPKVYSGLKLEVENQSKQFSVDAEALLVKFTSQKSNDKLPVFNDLEAPAFQLAPELAELKQKLETFGFSNVLMSGSGSAFFCLGDGNLPALASLNTYNCKFINRSPGKWYLP